MSGVAVRTPAGTPFAWTDPRGDALPGGPGGRFGAPARARVTQCALSRVCGVCADPLGRPIAFVGTAAEVGRNALHAPPMHLACAEALLDHPAADPGWRLLCTPAFEFVRPGRDEVETEPVFALHALLG